MWPQGGKAHGELRLLYQSMAISLACCAFRCSWILPLNTWTQARNQLGTTVGVKSFLRGAQIFWTVSKNFRLCPTSFVGGAKIFLGGLRSPWAWACLNLSTCCGILPRTCSIRCLGFSWRRHMLAFLVLIFITAWPQAAENRSSAYWRPGWRR